MRQATRSFRTLSPDREQKCDPGTNRQSREILQRRNDDHEPEEKDDRHWSLKRCRLDLAGREQRAIYIEFLYPALLSTLEFLCAICDMQIPIARLEQFQAKVAIGSAKRCDQSKQSIAVLIACQQKYSCA